MSILDILCGRIASAASELKGKTEILNSCRQMTLGEVDLLSAERHLKDALENVQELLAVIRSARKESA
jgi:hypothetical protein